MTTPATTSVRTGTPRTLRPFPAHARASAFTATPSSTASPSATSGTARLVLRSASPKLDDSANDLNVPPSADGSS